MTRNDAETRQFEDRAAVGFHPPVLLLILIVAGFILRWLAPGTFLPPGLAIPVGLPVIGVAVGLFAWAVTTMLRGGASIPTHTATDTLVASGPFRFSRNPIYLSMALLLAGIGIATNSAWFVAFAVLDAVLLTVYVIRPEEDYLERKFGDGYLNYKRGVRRWI